MTKDLSKLRAKNLPRATCATAFKRITGRAEIDAYLRDFADTDGKCPQCDATLGGLLGSFVWGIASGEGECSRCGYPCRAHHRDVGPLRFFEAVLPYHPESLTIAKATG